MENSQEQMSPPQEQEVQQIQSKNETMPPPEPWYKNRKKVIIFVIIGAVIGGIVSAYGEYSDQQNTMEADTMSNQESNLNEDYSASFFFNGNATFQAFINDTPLGDADENPNNKSYNRHVDEYVKEGENEFRIEVTPANDDPVTVQYGFKLFEGQNQTPIAQSGSPGEIVSFVDLELTGSKEVITTTFTAQ